MHSPSRLYAFSNDKYRGTAANATLFYVLWLAAVGLVLYGWVREGHKLAHMPILAFLLLGSYLVFGLFARFIWRSIPPLITFSSIDAARSFFEGRRFILIVWSTRQYADLIDHRHLGWNKDSGQDEIADVSWDSTVCEAAREIGLDTIRLCRPGESEFVGDQQKSIWVMCDGVLWKDVVISAMSLAVGIIVYPGVGEGLAWEVNTIDSTPTFRQKTFKGAPTVEFESWLKGNVIDVTKPK